MDQLQQHLDRAHKAFALKNWEQAVDAFAQALELSASIHGDYAPESAELLLLYGKSLLELATAQNQVMAQESAVPGAPVDDVDEGDDDEDDDNPARTTTSAVGEEGEAEEEPEDDFHAAWESLEAARALFAKMEGGVNRLQEAECLLTLGDVSLETENFTQAVEDFQSALDLKSPILPFSSRHISEAHLKLAMALEFAPSVADHRARALSHVERSKASLVERRAELESGQSAFSVLSEGDDKGKAKATEGVVLDQDVVKDRVEKLSAKEREDEVREIDEMMEDLDVKIEDLRTAPLPETALAGVLPSSSSSTFDLASSSSTKAEPTQVNDLSGMVKRKKPVRPTDAPAPAIKRKAEDPASGTDGKKVKV